MPHRLPYDLQQPIVFSGAMIHRDHLRRQDPEGLRREWERIDCAVLPLWKDAQYITADLSQAHPLSPAHPWVRALVGQGEQPPQQAVYLGQVAERPYFALDLPALSDDPPLDPQAPAQDPPLWRDLRPLAAALPSEDAALLATARGLLLWHRRHRYCGLCGHETLSELAGHQRRCCNPACASLHFPRTDPAVIMLVRDSSDRILLGRQAVWPAGMMSALAGFVEPGESLEQAVAREVFEEAGVQIGAVQYIGTQPWPFPSSLMIGFFAETDDPRLEVDHQELEMARWFTRDEVRQFRDSAFIEGPGFALPGRASIARHLIQLWLSLDRGLDTGLDKGNAR